MRPVSSLLLFAASLVPAFCWAAPTEATEVAGDGAASTTSSGAVAAAPQEAAAGATTSPTPQVGTDANTPASAPDTQPSAPAAASDPATAPATTAAVGPSPYGTSTSYEPGVSSREELPQKRVPETLLDSNYDYAFGGMGGIGVMYSRFGGKNVVLVCGEGAVIIDHAFTLGGGGCGMARSPKAREYSPAAYTDDDRIAFGYGGAIARYHFNSRKMVNYSLGVLVGAGGVTTGTWSEDPDDMEDQEFEVEHSDAVFVVEPQVGVHLNITRWLRIGAVMGYRAVSAVDTEGLDAADVSGITAGGQLQGGWF